MKPHMKSQYFCAYHAKQVCGSETQAFSQWAEVMRRGTKAYVQCRLEAATLFLNSALDIAQLRSECNSNNVFSVMHLCKPVEFLIQVAIAEGHFQKATALLNRLAILDVASLNTGACELNTFLGEQYAAIEMAEKDSMTTAGVEHSKREAVTPLMMGGAGAVLLH
ncbi:hypothetical protein [Marinagarivorans algicola]|uniref:hypothetical protein n=1 Tax=Marinagarivorans algicola TaxID=1513270 RepID=UPI0006B41401|nr:hypothetical protein [Marinagarivorans algicola]